MKKIPSTNAIILSHFADQEGLYKLDHLYR
jgi:hypothetical protein